MDWLGEMTSGLNGEENEKLTEWGDLLLAKWVKL